ncbi:MAG TPA: pyridoxine 5'-phosphate synthase [Bacteroidota bacterium]|nr:pyridoxine 5'-phosphate synthase [Bacteroidota bacterium]
MRLAINIDHVATLRNARGGKEPDPVEAAMICEAVGVAGIVCHLREDRRHIKDRDVLLLRKKMKTKLDLEMAATPEIIRIAVDIQPDLVTLVPEKRQELTTEGGLEIVGQKQYLKDVVENFHLYGIPVSLFVDPNESQIQTSKEIHADMIEIHTGEYAEAKSQKEKRVQLLRIKSMAKLGKSLGLGVNAGHGLDYTNIKPVAAIKEIDEVSIGHAIIVRAMFVGVERAVKEMMRLVKPKR